MKFSKHFTIALLIVVVVGVSLRAAYLVEHLQSPFYSQLQIDELYHDYWARGLVTGNWTPPLDHDHPHIEKYPYFKPPGTPYTMAFLYSIFGIYKCIPLIAFMFLGILSGLVLTLLAKQLFNTWSAFVTALLYFTYWGFIYFEATLLEPALTTFLLILSIYFLYGWLSKRSTWHFFIAAITAGLCALVRPNVLLCLPFMGVWCGYVSWRSQKRLLPAFLRVLCFGIISGTIVLLATIRNYKVSGDFVPLCTEGGLVLHTGNHAGADGYNATTPEIGGFTCFDWPRIVHLAEKNTGKKLTHAEAEAYYMKRGFSYIVQHPGHVFSLVIRKFLLFWGPAEVCNQKEAACDVALSKVLFPFITFPVILALCLLGIILLLLSHKNSSSKLNNNYSVKHYTIVLITIVVLVYAASYMPFQVAGRYRIPIIPFLMLGAGYGIWRLCEMMRKRAYVKAILWFGTVILIWFIVLINYAGYKPRVGHWRLTRGGAYLADGKPDKALKEFEEAITIRPWDERIYDNIGVALLHTGDIGRAEVYFRKALDKNPLYYRTLYNMGVIEHEKGNITNAYYWLKKAYKQRPDKRIVSELGVRAFSCGDLSNAVKYISQALEVKSDDIRMHTMLAAALAQQKKYADARRHLEKVLELGGSSSKVILALYRLCRETGDHAAALHYLENGATNYPQEGRLQYILARFYLEQGNEKEAAKAFERSMIANAPADVINEYAWLMATSTNTMVRNPKKAIKLATRACEMTQWTVLPTIDTLGVAYASDNQFEQAIQLMEKYRKLSKGEEERKIIDQRLEEYRSGKCEIK